ncbi:LysR substrate-binding domain-containing protein [Alphaproteobacteria bacterium]|nr:LysR substrate-binding domain-containing protein [Alphaproteobacteria bacterium]
MHRFTLRQLEYFVACVDAGSIAGAAVKLNVSQPTVSVAINKLEDQLGMQLLLRHHAQGVSVTAGALRLVQSARSLLSHASDVQREAMMISDDVESDDISGILRLGSFVTLAPSVLPGLITQFHKNYAGVKLDLQEGTQENLVEGLYSGTLEIALLYDLELPDDIRTLALAELEPYVLLPATHKLADQNDIDLDILAVEPMILFDVQPSRGFFLGLLNSVGVTPNIAYRTSSLELVRGMVGRGLGYSLLVTRPRGDLTYEGASLVARPIKNNITKSRIVLASLANLRPTRIMTKFEAVAQSYFDSWQ